MKKAIALTLVITTAMTATGCEAGKKESHVKHYEISSNVDDDSIETTPPPKETISPPKETTTTTSKPKETEPPKVTQTQAPVVTTKPPVVTSKPTTTTTSKPKETEPPKVEKPQPKPLICPTDAQCLVISNEIIRLVNEYRTTKGLSPYGTNTKINQAAKIRATEASNVDCFGHIRPDGTKWSTVYNDVKYGEPSYFETKINGEWIPQVQYGGGIGAENLAACSPLSIGQEENGKYYFECTNVELKKVAKLLFDDWKASPDHNKSMISVNYSYIGVGVYATYEMTMEKIPNKDIGFYGIQLFSNEDMKR